MTRPQRARHHEPLEGETSEGETVIKDENGIIHTTSRSLRKVNYAEVENNYDFIEEVVDEDEDEDDGAIARPRSKRRGQIPVSDNEDYVAGEELGDQNQGSPNAPVLEDTEASSNARSRSAAREDDDESFHDEDAEAEGEETLGGSEDEYYSEESIKRSRRRADRNFIVSDEEDDDNDDDTERIGNGKRRERRFRNNHNQEHSDDDDDDLTTGRNFRSSTIRARRGRRREDSPPRKLRRRGRSAYMNEEEPLSGEQLSLADELRELRDDSPIREKRSLRERTKPVNYTLPPPIGDNTIDEITKINNANAAHPYQSPKARRGLHAGQSFGPLRRLFPTGGPFGGNDVTAIFGTNTNYYDTATKDTGNNKLLLDSDSSEDEILPIGATPTKTDNTHKKKKPEIADLDPLGVDMNIKFEDVGGLDNYIDQLKEMVALPLLYPELYQKFGITPPRGVLFHGPPGTGKTLMARALAASCSTEQQKITFFMRKGADILSKWVGEAERQLRLLFDEAKKQQPSIIFFDEIDGLAPVRSSKQEQIHASIVSTMLALMDGMDNRGQVIVIGATNRPDAVDPALRRPGRFDREFFFPLPGLEARSKILTIHTKKWNPPLPNHFISKLASLTKGYGGADLRALCTEAALISIQRKLPQIYQSDIKLHIDPSTVNVKARDFMLALEKIVPSSARSVGSSAQPLPETTGILLADQFNEIKEKVNLILPTDTSVHPKGASIIKHYLEYEEDDSDEGKDEFLEAEFLRNVEKARVCKPRLLISANKGYGQQYVGPAILHHLENFSVQMLDVGTLVSDSTRSIEAAIVQAFSEARRRQPSVLYIPNCEIWLQAIPENAILLLASLLRSLKNNERILVLAIASGLSKHDITDGALSSLEFEHSIYKLRKPSSNQRKKYFYSLVQLLKTKPVSFSSGKKREKPLPKLEVAKGGLKAEDVDENGKPLSAEEKLLKTLKSFQAHDMKLKNTLKIKLSGLMDLFKNRYKRFRKPPIDDSLLIHLFEANVALQDNPDYQPAYIKEDNMILECTTGRKFFNMDLDIVEERLWNGFYSEPRQFLKDIELIYRDAHTSGDRERIIKASEMFVNAQMGIEEISTAEFMKECKASRQRELTRQKIYLDKQAELKSKQLEEEHESFSNELRTQEDSPSKSTDTYKNVDVDGTEITQQGIGSGSQLQCQAQIGSKDEGDDTMLIQDQPLSDDSNHIVPDSANNALHDISNAVKGASPQSSEENVETPMTTVEEEPTSNEKEAGTASGQAETAMKAPMPDVIVDEIALEEILRLLDEVTKGFTVEQLEEQYASLLNIIWADRSSWDKTLTLKKIIAHLQK